MNTTHDQSSLHQNNFLMGKIAVFFIVAVIFTTCGTIVWVLNIIGVIPGLWSNIFSAVFTGIGTTIALLNCLLTLVRIQNTQR